MISLTESTKPDDEADDVLSRVEDVDNVDNVPLAGACDVNEVD